jgi:hypothetical protein
MVLSLIGETYKTINLEIQDYVHRLHVHYEQFLKPGPLGLYLPFSHTPSFDQADEEGGALYYTLNDKGDYVAWLFETGYPDKGLWSLGTQGNFKQVLGALRKGQRRPYLMQPDLPYAATCIVDLVANEYIRNIVRSPHAVNLAGREVQDYLIAPDALIDAVIASRHVRLLTTYTAICGQNKPDSHKLAQARVEEEIAKGMRSVCNQLLTQIAAFVGPHVHNTYQCRVIGNVLHLVQGEDYRALQWQQEQLQKEYNRSEHG